MTLETMLNESRRDARALYRDIAQSAGARGFTADERAALQAAIDEARAINYDLIRARGGDPFLDQLAALDARPGRDVRSPGTQFVQSDGFAFFRRGDHRRAGVWESPRVEVIAPPSLHATTITEAGLTIGQVEPMRPVPRLPTLASILRQGTTTANAVQVPVETAPPTTALPLTAENAAKPALALGAWSLWTVPVNKVAGTVPVSEELFEDVPGLAAYIDARLMRASDLAVDADIVTQLSTLSGRTPDFAAAATTNASALLAQACHIYANSGYIPDFIALHPLALWATVAPPGEVLNGAMLFQDKDLTSAYLYGMRLLPTAAVPTPTTALVGDSDDAAQIFWRGDFAIQVTNSHLDNFTHDLLMLRGERRYALVSYYNPAFGLVTGLTVAA